MDKNRNLLLAGTAMAVLAGIIMFTFGPKSVHAQDDQSKTETGSPTDKKDGEKSKPKGKVVTTKSGLKYEVLKEGTGPKPGPTDQVTVHYTGTLLDGTVFDSSVERGKPATFPLNRVIKGWTEGLQLMPKGSKYRFTIPPELAYGPRAVGDKIKPNSTLVFVVELIDIDKK